MVRAEDSGSIEGRQVSHAFFPAKWEYAYHGIIYSKTLFLFLEDFTLFYYSVCTLERNGFGVQRDERCMSLSVDNHRNLMMHWNVALLTAKCTIGCLRFRIWVYSHSRGLPRCYSENIYQSVFASRPSVGFGTGTSTPRGMLAAAGLILITLCIILFVAYFLDLFTGRIFLRIVLHIPIFIVCQQAKSNSPPSCSG